MTTAERLPTTFDNSQAATFASINGRKLIEVDDAVGDTMNRAVRYLAGKVVQHQYGGLVLGEIVLERKDLAAVAERALRKKTKFRETVDHDALGLNALDFVKDSFCCFAKFQVRGIQKALVLIGIDHA